MYFPKFKYLPSLTRYAKERPLNYRLLVYIFICSFIFILLSTALQMRFDYQREIDNISTRMQLIRESYLATLSKSIWDFDRAQINLQLTGIAALQDIAYLELSDDTLSKTQRHPKSQASSLDYRLEVFTLLQQNATPARILGHLSVAVDMPKIRLRLWQNGIRTLINQSLLVLLIMIAMTIIIQRLVTRHLEAMAKYSRDIGAGKLDQPLVLQRKTPRKDDELDQLQTALNDMRLAIRSDLAQRDEAQLALRYNRDQLQQMVEQRTLSLKRAKDAAEHANSAKSQFLATMSHEIRTPMNGMLGMIQLLAQDTLNKQQHHQVNVLQDSTEALLGTFDHILEYAQLEQGAYHEKNAVFSLNSLAVNLVDLLQLSAQDKGLIIRLKLLVIDQLFCDKAASVRQIVTNLVANAIKFSTQGEILVELNVIESSKSSQKVCIRVSDSGIGIAPALQSRIFDRFTQADDSITRRFGGTGLGLSICRQLTELMEGELKVDSKQDVGSTFSVTVTLACYDAENTVKSSHLEPLAPLHILLVEDEAINREVIQALLLPHHTTIAEDGFSAIKEASMNRFDVILMDMHLPHISGLDVAQTICDNDNSLNKKTPIIAVTASVRPAEIAHYLTRNIQDVVAKPVIKRILIDSIQKVMKLNSSKATVNDMSPTRAVRSDSLLDTKLLESHIEILGEQKLATLMRLFVQQTPLLQEKILQSINENDSQQCELHAHKLAGSCDTLGFFAASKLLRQLEHSAKSSVLLPPETLIDTLAQSVAIAQEYCQN